MMILNILATALTVLQPLAAQTRVTPIPNPCNFHSDCSKTGGQCIWGRCADKQRDGRPCTEHIECKSGYCGYQFKTPSTAKTCIDPKQIKNSASGSLLSQLDLNMNNAISQITSSTSEDVMMTKSFQLNQGKEGLGLRGSFLDKNPDVSSAGNDAEETFA